MSKDKSGPRPPKLPKAPIRRKPDDGGSTPPSNSRFFVLLVIGAGVLMLAFYAHRLQVEGVTKEISYPEFITRLKGGEFEKVVVLNEPARGTSFLEGSIKPGLPVAPTSPVPGAEAKESAPAVPGIFGAAPTKPPAPQKYRAPIILESPLVRDLPEIFAQAGFPQVEQKTIDNTTWATLIGILPFILFILLMYFFFRQQIKMAGKNAFTFGKSKARLLSKDKNKITFKDVAGVDEAKDEVQEIVEFLKDPKRFQRLGGRIPKGVLMVGPPGTGKTLLAKAIAGEADVPFYGISGSDFVEMFVGVGASRVRDMFEQGRKTAPCLIFIDEIDAVGRSRGHGLGGGHDEREQTLNAMLVEMDGIDSQEGVIIIAATNRKDVLDPALLRPGRFDREVTVNLPDVKGREQILAVHARKVKVADGVDWSIIARGTPGFSGAELANLINEGALIAARRAAAAIELPDLEEARDKVRWGRERRSMAMSEEQKKITAYHEAGHAVLNVLLANTDPLHKVTIIPRGPALGVTMMLPKEDRYGYAKRQILDRLCVTMGGRVAEEIFLGEISSGASGDIQQATWFAKKMVCEWGMSEKLGMVQYGDHDEYVFLGREMSRARGYSEETAREIDKEVLAVVNTAYERASDLIKANRDKTEAIALALLEYETLDGTHVEDIMKHGEMKNPPPKNAAPPVTPLPQEPLDKAKPATKKGKDDGLLPGLEGAPAGA
ncbi:MAG: ATP-dependent zinc metalloprotease FtsH [Candidatus Methylacidiphilales bacterium]|nr:ATP-dependent zinc metalloprotease FtsH [Candidatus Methylacidiphilales bacterium]